MILVKESHASEVDVRRFFELDDFAPARTVR
jgi:hypothetical protein